MRLERPPGLLSSASKRFRTKGLGWFVSAPSCQQSPGTAEFNFRIAQDYRPMSIVERPSMNAGHPFSFHSRLPYLRAATPA